MLAAVLALALAAPAASPPDPRLLGCFAHLRSSAGHTTDFSVSTTLCLYPDGSATHDTLSTFLVFYGDSRQQREERRGTWSVRRGVLTFEDAEGRLTWRVQAFDDGLRLDGDWWRGHPLPEAEPEAEGEAEAGEDAGEDALTPEEEAALVEMLQRLKVLVEAWKREQALAQ